MTDIVDDAMPRLIAMRHELHRHPEISREEAWTSAFVAERLTEMGIPVHTGVGGYGVVGVVEGSGEGPGVALRADMDALAMDEHNSFAHRSQIQGAMHACGHDGHMTMLLGAASHLSQTRRFRGTVYLVFQPAEERYGGAQLMLDAGLLERFPVRNIFGLHNWPDVPPGEVVVHDGPVMAGAGEFTLTFKAPGGHAAMPHMTGDPVLAGSHFVTGIQQAVGRAINPLDAAVVTVGSFQGGFAQNVISREATLAGTFRGLRPDILALLRTRIEEIAQSAARIASTEVEIGFDELPSPPVVNTPAEAEIMRRAARALPGSPALHVGVPTMAGDDFGAFLEHLPGAYAWIGNGPSERHGRLHQPDYDFNDAIIGTGVRLLVATAEQALS
ncbi:M20 metallopeptidase family protein [Labrys neptuniae]